MSKAKAKPSALPPIPIVALDVPTLSAAKELVRKLGDAPDFYKVGLQLYTKEGPAVVEWLRGESKRVFLDLKLHDIPNTVQGAAASAAALGVELLTVHAIGGEVMLKAAVDGAGEKTGILGVTVLTSFDDTSYGEAIGAPGIGVKNSVLRLAAAAARAGTRGAVCAGSEAAAIRATHGQDFGTLVPGIRPADAEANDQARTTTPEEARTIGATWVVVGRVVTAAKDPSKAYQAIRASLGHK